MRKKITEQELFQEIKDSTDNLKDFLIDITKDKKLSKINPLSVELRKLLNPKGQGDQLLKRAEDIFKIKLEFPDRSKTLPPTEIKVPLEEYINRLAFSLGGRVVTRIDLIKLVADEKGAHTDENADILHTQSQGILLPLGNPARDKLFFEQNHRYLISFAYIVVTVVEEQIIKKLENRF